MVHLREGGAEISSPHLIEAFGDPKPKKMERCDSDWIIILFFIHLNVFKMEKLKESTHGAIFTNETQFGKLRFETFREQFKA